MTTPTAIRSYPSPLGVTLVEGGANVALYSSAATAVWFCTFDGSGAEQRHPVPFVDANIWHCFVSGVTAGQQYGFRVEGPYDPPNGYRCNPAKLLLDPYGRALTGNLAWAPSWAGGDDSTPNALDSAADAPRSVVLRSDFDWGSDRPLDRYLVDTVIYELHVKGFTIAHPGVAPADRGTYAGLGSSAVIEYLTGLGVNAVELMPVHQFLPESGPAGLSNYWGYDTINFFSLHAAYSSARRAGGSPGSEAAEFKSMVKSLHEAGIEVIIDVVFNHTAEGDQSGPTLCFRGIDNLTYYQLVGGQRQYYDNLTGTGNTINASSPVVRRLVLDSLRYWVEEMHVDGFRFDLAAVLASDNPPSGAGADPVWDGSSAFFDLLVQDPTLAHTKLIAEPWTNGGDEQGQFPSRWSEWNGEYRGVMRDYWRAQLSAPRWAGARLAGSPDMYVPPGTAYGLRRQIGSTVNLITCHDGFTLADLVAYDTKHNLANQQGNTDGTDDNRSWNCGSSPADDGPTTDPQIAALRRRQQRNLLTTLLLARGVPLLLAGDERNRTQQGNNNAYCQDNATSWLDWTEDPAARNLTTVVQKLLSLRAGTPAIRAPRFPGPDETTASEPVPDTGLLWYDPDGAPSSRDDWDNASGHAVAAVFCGVAPEPSVLAMLNAWWGPVTFTLPPAPSGGAWTLEIDTTAEDGTPGAEPADRRATVVVGPRSVVVARG